jgi:hypothetical protein
MLFAGHIGMGLQLRSQVGLQQCSYDLWSAWDCFGGHIACFSSLFEIPLDGGS